MTSDRRDRLRASLLRDQRVLVCDDEAAVRRTTRRILERYGATVVEAEDGQQAMDLLTDRDLDAVMLDVSMPDHGGIDVLRWMRARGLAVPVVLVTGRATVPIAVEAVRLGAHDVIQKPVDLDKLLEAVEGALAGWSRDETSASGELLGGSPEMREVRRSIRRVGSFDVPVLVRGESGVGKELVARALHQASPRVAGPFVAFNVAAIPDALFEAELFGHVRGAFTGATQDRTGLLVEADGGTLVFDEIGELSLQNQVKLLRVLETREVRPVGGTRSVPFDVRVVACTNKDLEQEVLEGRFRSDLYYRLHGVEVLVPPLRDRPGDIELLARTFLKRASDRHGLKLQGFDEAAIRLLRAHSWPGNVRELLHAVTSAAILSMGPWVTAYDLPRTVQSAMGTATPASTATLEDAERDHLVQVLHRAQGNRTRAAEELGVSRSTLYRLMRKHHL